MADGHGHGHGHEHDEAMHEDEEYHLNEMTEEELHDYYHEHRLAH